MSQLQKLESKNLTWFPVSEKQPILDKISASFMSGKFYGIIGPNGSGKSSFVRHILNFLKHTKGSVCLNGKEVECYSRLELAKNLALVPQNTSIDTSFSAYEIVSMGRNPYQKRFGGETKEDIHKVKEAMKMTSCLEFKDKPFRNLSGGEAQRVIVARAIAQDTPWLLLDEPISNLDIRHQLELMETLKKLNSERKTSILAILHDINLAVSYCSDIIMMKEGQIKYMGETLEVLTCERLFEVYGVQFLKISHPETKKPYFLAQYSSSVELAD